MSEYTVNMDTPYKSIHWVLLIGRLEILSHLFWLHAVVDLWDHPWDRHACLGQLEEVLLHSAGDLGGGVRGRGQVEGEEGVWCEGRVK